MKVLLIRTENTYVRIMPEREGRFVPTGILLVAAVLEKAAHEVKILDINIESDKNAIEKFVQSFAPSIVGIGGMSVDLVTIIRYAGTIKSIDPLIKVIIGGPIASSIPEHLLKDKNIDYVVVGEGEESCVELVRKLENKEDLKDIKGIGFKENGNIVINPKRENINMDKIPFPARHLIDMNKYISTYYERFHNAIINGSPVRGTNIVVSRGCPFSCIYCDQNVYGHKWRIKSVEFVLSEIEMLIEKYKINAIMFDDDEFDLNKKWIRHFCEEIIERELKFIWHCNSRCNYAEKEIYLLMYDAGCRSVSFGIEFGNQKILDFAMKQLTVEQIEKGVKYAKGAGLNVAGYFMMGMMGETEETIKDTINLALRLPLDSGSFGLTVPMIGTELYNMALREGYISKEYWGQWVRTRALVNMTKNLSQNQLNKYVRMANWQFFWSRPRRRIPKTIRKIIIRLFPILYFFTGKKFGEVVFLVNGVRRFLRIPLS